jgi:hypothetical protein
MDSAINMHLAVTKLQDSLRVAESARAAGATPRAARRRRPARPATTWLGKRRAPALPDRAAAAAVPPDPRTALRA